MHVRTLSITISVLHKHVHTHDPTLTLAPSTTVPAHPPRPAVLPPATVHDSKHQSHANIVANAHTVATVPETGPRPHTALPDHYPGRARLTQWRCTAARDVHARVDSTFPTTQVRGTPQAPENATSIPVSICDPTRVDSPYMSFHSNRTLPFPPTRTLQGQIQLKVQGVPKQRPCAPSLRRMQWPSPPTFS